MLGLQIERKPLVPENLTPLLRQMRGETSLPLIEELGRLVSDAQKAGRSRVCVQLESRIFGTGLSVVFDLAERFCARVYFSWSDVRGLLPRGLRQSLVEAGWQIEGDNRTFEFAVSFKIFEELYTPEHLANTVIALETLGIPRKKHWKLNDESPQKLSD